MRSGSWASIGLIYLHGVLASASLSKIIPLLADISSHLGAQPAQFGLLISLMTLAPAVFAAVAGSAIDRTGSRIALRAAVATGLLVNLAFLWATSLHAFMALRVIEGFVVVGIYSAAPALIMATAGAARRARAMSVWSTYTPVGMSLGLLLSAKFAGTPAWRSGYLLHALLFAALLVADWWLPRSPVVQQTARKPQGMLAAALSQVQPVRLSLAFASLVLMGFGMSTVFPDWYASQHQVSVGVASGILAMTNLAMIPGGLFSGWLLARGVRDVTLLGSLMLVAVAVAVPLFMPGHGPALRVAAMLAWLMTQGAAIAVVTAALPRVVANPAQGAAAAGLLSQIAAITTFVTPLVWRPLLAGGNWLLFVAVVMAACIGAIALFPRRAAAMN
jgi:MFS family permease